MVGGLNDFHLFRNYPVHYIRMGSIHIKKFCKAGDKTESSWYVWDSVCLCEVEASRVAIAYGATG